MSGCVDEFCFGRIKIFGAGGKCIVSSVGDDGGGVSLGTIDLFLLPDEHHLPAPVGRRATSGRITVSVKGFTDLVLGADVFAVVVENAFRCVFKDDAMSGLMVMGRSDGVVIVHDCIKDGNMNRLAAVYERVMRDVALLKSVHVALMEDRPSRGRLLIVRANAADRAKLGG